MGGVRVVMWEMWRWGCKDGDVGDVEVGSVRVVMWEMCRNGGCKGGDVGDVEVGV